MGCHPAHWRTHIFKMAKANDIDDNYGIIMILYGYCYNDIMDIIITCGYYNDIPILWYLLVMILAD